MQLVCNIPNELYTKWEQSKFTLDEAYQFVDCVMNGKPIDDVLDKIRAEIEKEIIPGSSHQYDYEAKWQNVGLRMALKVIDKYKAESSKTEQELAYANQETMMPAT